MPKSYFDDRTEFEDIFSFQSIYRAYNKAKKSKTYRKEIYNFDQMLIPNLYKIQYEVLNNIYSFGPYKTFILFDSKRRYIVSSPFDDRIVHWVLYEYLTLRFEKSFINDSFGNIKGRGTHLGVSRAKKFMCKEKNKYVLKIDFSKYFYSIHHDVLKNILSQIIQNKYILELLFGLIDSYKTGDLFDDLFRKDSVYFSTEKKGIPIGSLTSQIFANIYLNKLDHFVKDYMRTKFYIRYVDDLVIFGETKEDLWNKYRNIKDFCLINLGLEINPKKIFIQPTLKPLDFLGYRISKYFILPRKNTQKKIRKAMCLNNTDVLRSYYGLVNKSDSHLSIILKYQIDLISNG